MKATSILVATFIMGQFFFLANMSFGQTPDPALMFTSAQARQGTNEIAAQVNLFTGDFETLINLYTVNSRNGLTFPINLVYNSNVEDIVEAENKDRQASWVGLGWHLDVPFILETNLNPSTSSDLRFIDGSTSNRMIFTGTPGEYKFENYKFWKVMNANDVWEMVTEDGTTLRFQNRRYYVFRNYINGLVQSYVTNLVYRWDLSEIEDVFGNKITFNYEVTTEFISDYFGLANPTKVSNYETYTKASYLKDIRDVSTGRVIVFEREPRNDFEDGFSGFFDLVDDPANNLSDSFEEVFTTERLKSIKVYDKDPVLPGASIIFQTDFSYDYVSNGSDDKLILTSIDRVNPDDPLDKLPPHTFEYNQIISPNFYLGALARIVFPHGGSNFVLYEARDCGNGWRVTSVNLNDKVGFNNKTTFYTWSTSQSYENDSFCGHGSVDLDLPGAEFGKIKYTHETDENTHLLGTPKKIEFFKEGTSSNPVLVRDNTWLAEDQGDGAFYTKLTSTTANIDGISTTTSFTYNSQNGLVATVDETNSDGQVRWTDFLYAFEEYPGMQTKNMLSQLAEQRTYIPPHPQTSVFSVDITTWKEWPGGSGKWAPGKTYSWNEAGQSNGYTVLDFDFQNWSDVDLEPTEVKWLRTSMVTSRDNNGLVTAVLDGKGVFSSNLWGHNNILPIANFIYANSEEFGFTSFENDEGNGWSHEEQITDEEPHTGVKSQKVGNFNGHRFGATQDFSKTAGLISDTGFRASVWVMGPATASLWMNINNTTLHQIAFSQNSGDWELLEVELTKDEVTQNMTNSNDFIRVFVQNDSNTPAYFDDIMFYAIDGQMIATVFDVNTDDVLAVAADNNRPTIFKYDAFARLKETLNSEGKLVSTIDYYFSKDGNGGQFNANNPNSITTTVHYSETAGDESVAVQYLDGVGRPVQSQAKNGNQKVVQQFVEDELGRAAVTTKPAFVTGALGYDTNFIPSFWAIGAAMTSGNLNAYYSAAGDGPDAGGYPYLRTQFSDNPLGRVQEIVNPGSNFRIGSGHGIGYSYAANSGSDVSGYSANELFKGTLTDENGDSYEVFVDKLGNTISVKSPESIDAFYEYDLLGNLTKVIPPAAQGDNQSPFNSAYEYNTLGQLIAQTSPDLDNDGDGDPSNETLSNPDVRQKYDANGNPRFLQDPVRDQGGDDLIFYKYDALNRIITVGVATLDAAIPLWSDLDPNQSYETGTHNFENETAHPDYLRMKNVYNEEPPYGSDVWASAVDPGQLNNLRGRLAATAHRNDGGASWVFTYFSYDSDSNIESVVHQIDGFSKKIEYEYDFTGNITKIIYNRNGSNSFYLWYDINDLGQLEAVFTNVSDSKPSLAAARYEYWPTGQIKTEKLGEKTGQQFADILNYTYNERDWLRGMNAETGIADINPSSPSTNFAMHLNYFNGQGSAEHNGTISDAAYFTKRPEGNFGTPEGSYFHRYLFGYDAYSRVNSAAYSFATDPSIWLTNTTQAYNVPNASYDKNGNITGFTRKDETGAGNALTYHYRNATTDLLDWVQNLNSQLSGNYSYDRNGNLIQDASKEIANVKYDHRNLPLEIEFNIPDQLDLNNGTISSTRTYQAKNLITAQSSYTVASSGDVTFEAGSEIRLLPGFTAEAGSDFHALIDPNLINAQSNEITNRYDYSGNRIRKNYSTGLERHYIRGYGGHTLAVLDENGTELFYNIRGFDLIGRHEVGTNEQFYHLKDHLGNVRVTINDDGNVMGYNDYYPFGLQMPRRTYSGGLVNNLYKYSSKELDEENNLGWYYFGARFYDPEVGRWPVTDPIAQSFSPYSFVGNNPMIYVDPDGRLFGGLLGFLGGLVNDFFGALSRSNQPGLSFSIGGPGTITDNSIPGGLAFQSGPGLPRDHRHGPLGSCICPGRSQLIRNLDPQVAANIILGKAGQPASIRERAALLQAIQNQYGERVMLAFLQKTRPDFELAHDIALVTTSLAVGVIGGAAFSPQIAAEAQLLIGSVRLASDLAVKGTSIATGVALNQAKATFDLIRGVFLRNPVAFTDATRIGTRAVFGDGPVPLTTAGKKIDVAVQFTRKTVLDFATKVGF